METESGEGVLITGTGEVLGGEFMQPLGISINRVRGTSMFAQPHPRDRARHARSPRIPRSGLPPIFDTTLETWLNLLTDYGLRVARRTVGGEIAKVVRKPGAA